MYSFFLEIQKIFKQDYDENFFKTCSQMSRVYSNWRSWLPAEQQCVTLSSNMLYTLYSEHWGWLLCCVSSHLSSATTMWLTGRNFHPTCLLVSRLRGKKLCSLAAKLSLRVLVRTSRKASMRRPQFYIQLLHFGTWIMPFGLLGSKRKHFWNDGISA